jgi:hypothetical protein
MEVTVNYHQTACGITFCNKNIHTWKRLHLKKCVICSESKKSKMHYYNHPPTNISAQSHMNTDSNKYGNIMT